MTIDVNRLRAFSAALHASYGPDTSDIVLAASREGRYVMHADLDALLAVYEAACEQVDRDGPLIVSDRRRDHVCVAVDAARGVTAEQAIRARRDEVDEAWGAADAAAGPPMRDPCAHPVTSRGANVPRVYGSWQTEVCEKCGAFRTHGHDQGRSNLSAWRPTTEYASATAPGEYDE